MALSPFAQRLQTALRAQRTPPIRDFERWIALARDCATVREFWERAALVEGCEGLAAERSFIAPALSCRRCGGRPLTTRVTFGGVTRSTDPTCRRCSIAWRKRAYREAVPASWRDAVMLAANCRTMEDGERLARQVNAALRSFGEPDAHAFAWVIEEASQWDTLWDQRPAPLNRAIGAGRARSKLNPVLLCDEVSAVETVGPLDVDIARDLVAAEGWSHAAPEVPERVAFEALDALYHAGVIYCGTDRNRARLRLSWSMDDALLAKLPAAR